MRLGRVDFRHIDGNIDIQIRIGFVIVAHRWRCRHLGDGLSERWHGVHVSAVLVGEWNGSADAGLLLRLFRFQLCIDAELFLQIQLMEIFLFADA